MKCLRRWAALAFGGLLALAACADDLEPVHVEAECPDQESACEVGLRECVGDEVRQCAPDERGCGVWSSLFTCGPGLCFEGSCGGAPGCSPAPEVCDGADDDCDELVDEGVAGCATACAPACERGSTQCAEAGAIQTCALVEGCLRWGAPRGCGGGRSCVEGACAQGEDCHDFDGDGFGLGEACGQQDCDDTRPTIHPEADEVCGEVDEDCDGQIDEELDCPTCNNGCLIGGPTCAGQDVVQCLAGPDGCGVEDVLTRCEAEEICQEGACALYVCDADAFEPNDAIDQAAAVEIDALVEAVACRGDEDWFDLGAVEPGRLIVASLRTEAEPAALRLSLVEGGRSLGSEIVVAGRHTLQVRATGQGAVRVGVEALGAGSGGYTVQVRAFDPEICDVDAFEPNDAIDQAALVEVGVEVEAAACAGDEDWFDLGAVAPGESLLVEIDDAGLSGRIAALLVDNETEAVLAATDRRGGHHLLYRRGVGAQGSASVRLVIVAEGEAVGGRYGLSAERFSAEGCGGDDGEPNDIPELAVNVALVEGRARTLTGAARGTICVGDEDWLALPALPPDAEIVVEVHGSGQDLDAELYSTGARLVARGAGGGVEVLRYQVPFERRGVFFVRVFGFGASRGDYEVRVSVALPPACEDDAFEPDGAPNLGAQVASGERREAFLCRGDQDWVTIGAVEEAGGSVRLSLRHEGEPGAMSLELFRHNVRVALGSPIEGGVEVDDVLEAGFYTALISGPTGASAAYSLDVELIGPPPCMEDDFEPNDALDAAVALAPGESIIAQICAGDSDFYRIDADLEVGQTIRIEVLFSHEGGEGDIDVSLFRDSARVEISDSGDDDEQIVHEVGETGVYTIEVYGFREAEAPYELVVEIDGGT